MGWIGRPACKNETDKPLGSAVTSVTCRNTPQFMRIDIYIYIFILLAHLTPEHSLSGKWTTTSSNVSLQGPSKLACEALRGFLKKSSLRSDDRWMYFPITQQHRQNPRGCVQIPLEVMGKLRKCQVKDHLAHCRDGSISICKRVPVADRREVQGGGTGTHSVRKLDTMFQPTLSQQEDEALARWIIAGELRCAEM